MFFHASKKLSVHIDIFMIICYNRNVNFRKSQNAVSE